MEIKMYINGEWKDAKEKRKIINPANGEIIFQAAEGTVEDMKKAINAARTSFDEGVWPNLQATKRASYLLKIADKIDEMRDKLVQLETLNNGKPYREARIDIEEASACFRYYAGLISAPNGQTYSTSELVQSMVIKQPVGVCGLIVPWNFPLLMSVWKLAPALAAGNTVILKPSEITPVTVYELFKIFDEVKLPVGVTNMVLGSGETVGNELVENRDVDMISFTGGTRTGKHIMRTASINVKKVMLELGGKSPNIIFDDADFETAVDYALYGIYYGSGQVCSAGSRILIEDSIYDNFVNLFAERARKIRVGPGNIPNVEMGPLVSEEHMKKVLEYIEIGKEEGARLICGGKRITSGGLDQGYFVEPTAFADTTQNMRIVQEEIFGPVAIFQKFKDENEAVKLANSTDYGLAGSVFTQNGSKAMRIIKKVRSGITWINSYHLTGNELPWGGYKLSGIGRGLGSYGLEEFQEVKQININLEVEPTGWFSR